jgi:hypothetical protein
MATFLGGTVCESGPGNFVYETIWRDDDGSNFTYVGEEFLELDEALASFYRDAREHGVKCSVDVYEYKEGVDTRHFLPQTKDPHEGTD